MNEQIEVFDIANELIIIPNAVIDKILKIDSKSKGDAISLYVFYYYTAKWQKTNQPKAIDRYSKLCLKIGSDRIKKAQKILFDLNLIERIIRKNKEGKIQGWYIKLNYIFKKDTVENVISSSQTPISIYHEFEILKNDGLLDILLEKTNKCHYCGCELTRLKNIYKIYNSAKEVYDYIKKNNINIATIDHIKPLSKGGTNEITNLLLSCSKCNSLKGNHYTENPLVDKPINGNQKTNALSSNSLNSLNSNNKSNQDCSSSKVDIKKNIDWLYKRLDERKLLPHGQKSRTAWYMKQRTIILGLLKDFPKWDDSDFDFMLRRHVENDSFWCNAFRSFEHMRTIYDQLQTEYKR